MGKKIIMLCVMFIVCIGNMTLANERSLEEIKSIQSKDDTEIESLEKFLNENNQGKDIKDVEFEKTELFSNEKLKIITKKLSWNSELDLSNKPKKIVMHHIEASRSNSNVRVEEIHQWHQNNGWAGIGYHFYINKNGEIYRGRPENAIGAHAKNHNIDTLGIAVEGKYNSETMPTKQKEAVILLGKYLRQKYKIDAIKKHKDLVPTSCPGNNYPFESIKNSILEEVINTNGIYEWRKESGSLFFYDTWLNEKAHGKIMYGNKEYAVDREKGILTKGFIELDGIKYYIKDNFKYAVGWQKMNNKWYYFDEDGNMQKGWKYINANWYYLNKDGDMKTGWIYDENWYFLSSEGSLAKGWTYVDKWYYMDEYTGVMQKGWLWNDESWYFLNNDGSMAKGWVYDKNWYYMNRDGKMLSGWNEIDDKWYYLQKNGVMITGWSFVEDYWYCFKEDGEMYTQWQWIDDKWYYFGDEGIMRRDWQLIDNNWYYFTYSGDMITNQVIDGWYIGYDGIAKLA